MLSREVSRETLIRELEETSPEVVQCPSTRRQTTHLNLDDSRQQRLSAQIKALQLIQRGFSVPTEVMLAAGGQLEEIRRTDQRFSVPQDPARNEEWFHRAARPDFWELPGYVMHDLAAGGDLSRIYEDQDEELLRRMRARIPSSRSIPQ